MSAFGFGTPFAEQLTFFREKLKLPSEHWDDIMHEAHDRAFIVAGAMKADLLDDLQQAVFSRMADGGGAYNSDFSSAGLGAPGTGGLVILLWGGRVFTAGIGSF